MEKDSNLRRRCQQIYSLPPLATRESTHGLYGTYRARTYDPLLVRQMLSQLSYDPIQTTQKRLELSTSAVTGRRSNQLSHWAIQNIKLLKWTFGDSNPGPTGYEPVALTN